MATTTRRITASGFPERLLTAEEFWELPEVEGKQYELVEGVVIEMAGPGYEHSLIVEAIGDLLKGFTRGKRLGYVTRDNTMFILQRSPDTVRGPDVSFVLRERVEAVGIPKRHFPAAPDLAVEVASPHDRARELHSKAGNYLAAGVRLVWLVWPDTQTVTVYSPDDEPREYGADDTLDGSDVLPGFIVTVRDLFDITQ